MSLLGAVLAGGSSRRFGSPKALVRLHGRPLWKLAAERLQRACGKVVLVAGGERSADSAGSKAAFRTPFPGVDVICDPVPGLGPLGGIVPALSRAKSDGLDGVLVLAADMPWVSDDVLRRLADTAEIGQAVVPRTDSPWGFEPLCAVYPVGALVALERTLADGALASGAFARSLDPVVIEPGVASHSFRSVNYPGDLPPPAVSIVGNKKSGKTTLTVALVSELARRGRRVMSAKHGHRFRLDTPGTDSWRHRRDGGAERVLLAGPAEFAVIGERGPEATMPLDLLLSTYLADAEIVVVEGFRNEALPKIEIFRSAAQPESVLDPRGAREAGALAVVTDRPDLPWSVPALDPDAPDLAVRLAGIVERALMSENPLPETNE